MTSHFPHQLQPPASSGRKKKSSAIFISLLNIFKFSPFFIFFKENPWKLHQKHSNRALLRSANELAWVEPSPGGSLQRPSSLVLAALIMILINAIFMHSLIHVHMHTLHYCSCLAFPTFKKKKIFCFDTVSLTRRAVISAVSRISTASSQGQCLKPETDVLLQC